MTEEEIRILKEEIKTSILTDIKSGITQAVKDNLKIEFNSGHPEKKINDSDISYYKSYAAFASNLRNWLIGASVASIALILSKENLTSKISQSHLKKTIAICFLVGVLSQIVAAWIYKTAMWYLYLGEASTTKDKDEFKKKWYYKASDWVSEQYWLEWLFDFVSAVFIGCAIYHTYNVII